MNLHERLELLIGQSDLPERTAQLIRAAFSGESDLTAAVAGDAPVTASPAPSASGQQPVWLNSIAVQGFRGIGPRAELTLDPRPGLTLVVGRNGSGKSSFAEGLEALLTGDNQRWRGRPAAWREGWRNLHCDEASWITAEFQREGDNDITAITRRFADDFDSATTEATFNGATTPYEHLGWDGPLDTFKPFLSYNELGTMLEQKPSAIYDSIAAVLGLEQLADALAGLRTARLEAAKPGKELKVKTSHLRETLEDSADARADEVLALLTARTPDLDAIRAFASVGGDSQPELSAIANLSAPDADRCREAAAAIRQALDALAQHAGGEADRAARMAEILHAAIQHHGDVGDGDCPVCGEGQLDASWAIRAAAEAEELRVQSAEIRAADQRVRSSRQEGLVCLMKPPSVLATQPDGSPGQTLHRAWLDWSTAPDGGFTETELIDRLESTDALVAQVEQVKASAAHDLDELEEEWRPLASQLAIWVEEARNAAIATVRANELQQAEDFLRSAEATIREERFAPIATQAAELWDGLRQQSNVSLESVALAGKNTQRRVELDVTVDGTETSALGVMSQGELHALALALFLPRVTSDESPFRFVMIDDPVQAMDAARVDGLARVLHKVAQRRQVVVFTHDDRLPAACRRLRLDAEVFQVDRRSGSKVSARWVGGPSKTALDDAFALAKTQSLPPSLKNRIVPMHCRRAVEAAATDEVWRRLLAEGMSHDQVEETLAGVHKTTDLLALLFFGRSASTPEVYEALGSIDHSLKDRLGLLNKAAHEPQPGMDAEKLVKDARKLVEAIESYRP